MKTNYPIGDIKFYWTVHVDRMKAQGKPAVCYPQFYRRVASGMILHDAIYTPAAYVANRKKPTQISDYIRRTAKLKAENVSLIELDKQPTYYNHHHFRPRKDLRNRFISLFR